MRSRNLTIDDVSSNGIFYLQGAYWKARKLGIFNGKELAKLIMPQ